MTSEQMESRIRKLTIGVAVLAGIVVLAIALFVAVADGMPIVVLPTIH